MGRLPDLELVIKAVLRSYDVQGIETAIREIDGTNGAIASGKAYFSGIPIKMFMAGYQPQNGTEVHDMVFILSSFPWDEGTLSLLKTIHVDKGSHLIFQRTEPFLSLQMIYSHMHKRPVAGELISDEDRMKSLSVLPIEVRDAYLDVTRNHRRLLERLAQR